MCEIEKTNCFLCNQIYIALQTIDTDQTTDINVIKQKRIELINLKRIIVITGMLFEYVNMLHIDGKYSIIPDEILHHFLSVYSDLYRQILDLILVGNHTWGDRHGIQFKNE